MLEIGTTFKYSWSAGGDYDDDEEYAEEVTVMGYVFFVGDLYYTCIGPSNVEVDVWEGTAENAADD